MENVNIQSMELEAPAVNRENARVPKFEAFKR